MRVKDAEKQIDKILNEGAVEAGIFISMLVDRYIKTYDITERQFNRSLKNSLKILNEDKDVSFNNKN